jgi:hypothetical protein
VRSLAGLSLAHSLTAAQVKADPAVVAFYRTMLQSNKDQEESELDQATTNAGREVSTNKRWQH